MLALCRTPVAVSARFSLLGRAAMAAPLAALRAEEKSKSHGSYHWTFERSLSLVSLPLVTGAVALGPTPYIDFALGFVIPLHCYFGFESMIEDYLPARRVGILYSILIWTTRILTGVAIYGCYVINTTDVGITALAQRLWTGKK
ncbi:CybS-domain-containing protein [Entophlyctis helioformis]|nr:CybS-domain-containing protein [Entophlyctis helioformis]